MIEFGKDGEILEVKESYTNVEHMKENLKMIRIEGVLDNNIIQFIVPTRNIKKLVIEAGVIKDIDLIAKL